MLGQRFFEGYACNTPMVSMNRPTLNPYKLAKEGIYLYELDDLDTVIEGMRMALSRTDPIVRRPKPMYWTEKVQFIIDKFIGSSG